MLQLLPVFFAYSMQLYWSSKILSLSHGNRTDQNMLGIDEFNIQTNQ